MCIVCFVVYLWYINCVFDIMCTKLKICGVRIKEDIEIVNKYSIDFMGFVFAESPRKVSKDEAKYLSSLLNSNIVPVGVFVDEDIDFIVELYKENIISIAQLHGDEDEDYIQYLRNKSFKEVGSNIPIIKAIEINDFADLDSIDDFEVKKRMCNSRIKSKLELSCDYFLFDSGKGSGKMFDWSLIDKDIIGKKPFFLAGGLNKSNLTSAILEFEPFAVDLSSGVETNKVKDDSKIKDIVNLIK